jgi:methanethiol S-methyltransferase
MVDPGPCSAPPPPAAAFVLDLALIALFGLQHSVMARASFKRRWTQLVPAPVERSTYVLLASLSLLQLFWQWRPLPGVVWQVYHPLGIAVLWGLFALGWLVALVATFQIDHLELTGLCPIWNDIRAVEPASSALKTPWLYRLVRHPMMLGLLIAFWAAPAMTTGCSSPLA